MSGSQHPRAEIEQFNMHLQRLQSNQVNIPDSIAGMMILLALPARWDHVSAIYLQSKTTDEDPWILPLEISILQYSLHSITILNGESLKNSNHFQEKLSVV